jgi:hypothetical protein
MRALRSAVLLAAIACLPAGPAAQGLADAARRASAAPQPTATKKYTNDDVEAAKPAAPAPPAAAVPAEAAAEAATGEPAKAAPVDSASAEEAKSVDAEPKKAAEYVVNRIAALKAQVADKEKQLRDTQARGARSDAALVTKQIANLQKELRFLEARLASRE